MGFAVPIEDWIRGPLNEWATDLMSEESLKRQGYLNSKLVNTTWKEHLSGAKNHQHRLWSVLMFQTWLADKR